MPKKVWMRLPFLPAPTDAHTTSGVIVQETVLLDLPPTRFAYPSYKPEEIY